MDIDISCVHELWAAPKENWLDHFVNTTRFKKLLNEETKSVEQREELRNLVIQFAEQAVQVESETETLIKKQFGREDIAFHERKASCLWLCCLASLAAIEWHFECLMQRPEDVLLVNSIFDKIEFWKENISSSSSVSFSSFLLARWFCFVHAYFRVPPPEAKQTVSNPCNQLDVAIQRFEHSKALAVKLRGRIEDSIQKLELMTTEKKGLFVPRPDCFIDPFVQEGGLSLSIGIVGENVLVGGDSLHPRVPSGNPSDTVVISSEHVVQKIFFERASEFFCDGKMIEAIGSFKQLLKFLSPSSQSSPHPLVRIDERKVNGYADAFRISPPYPNAVPSTSKTEVRGVITSIDLNPARVPQRRYGTRRDRLAEEQARSGGLPLSSIRSDPLSMCHDVMTGGNAVGWRSKMEKTDGERKRQAIESLVAMCTPPLSLCLPLAKRCIVRGTARYLAATTEEWKGLEHSLSIPPSTFKLPKLKNQPDPPPSAASIRSLAASDKPIWTILTSFSIEELLGAFTNEGTNYFRPLLLRRCPEILGDLILLRNQPVDDFRALLLGKLYQLAEMGDHVRWQSNLDSYAVHLKLNDASHLVEASIYEAIRVRMVCLNKQLLSPHCNLYKAQVDETHSLGKNIVNISQKPPLLVPMLAFLLNRNDCQFVCTGLDPTANNSILNVGRVLAVFVVTVQGEQVQPPNMAAFADTWHKLISPYYEAIASKRRHDGFTTMHLKETSRVRIELMRLFESIKLQALQEVLISYFATLYTQALAARGRAHLRIYSPKGDLFAGCSLQLAHMEALEEILTILLDRALSVDPEKAVLLRTKADFAYVRNQLNEAAITYCELLVSMKPSLAMPLPSISGVIDDSVWNHLRICLRKNNQQTLAACVCQLFTTGRAKEYRKAAEAIQDRSCLDASDDCFGLVYDVQLAEALTDAYKKRGQQQKLESLLDILASPTMNLNNGQAIVERETRRKQKRMLNSLAALHIGLHS